jgi:DNA-binding IclR family transcriptional regulator
LNALLDHLLRQPATTAPALAWTLEITPQAALRLLARLQQEGLVTEVTGRGSFRHSQSRSHSNARLMADRSSLFDYVNPKRP